MERRKFLLLASHVVVGGLVSLASLLFPASRLLQGAGFVAGVTLTVALQYGAFVASRRARTKQLTTVLLHGYWPLRTVKDADPYDLGVLRSTTADRYAPEGERPPYVPRDVDEELELALERSARSGRLVVVVGPSKAGKSRTAFEAVSRLFPDRRIIAPTMPDRSGRPLHTLLDVDPPMAVTPPGPVLWLDDLEHYVRGDDLRPGTISAFRDLYPGLVAIGTLRLAERAALHESREVERHMRGLFGPELVEEIHLERELTDSERHEAQGLYGEVAMLPEFKALGEYLAAAKELRDKYEDGREREPVGRAVVDVVIGWRQAGMNRPMPEPDLRELAAQILSELRPGVALTPDDFARGVQWAIAPVVSSAALLVVRTSGDSRMFTVFDYIVEWITAAGRAVSETTWRFVLSRATAEDYRSVTLAARRAGRPGAAEELTRAIAASPGPAAAWIDLDRNVLLAARGDLEGARRGYERVIASGHPEVEGPARLQLGRLLIALGDEQGAEDCWRRAAASPDADAAAGAGHHLGLLLAQWGDVAGAEAAWQEAALRPEQEGGRRAACQLAERHLAQGRAAVAVAVLSQAAKHDETGEVKAIRAGALLQQRDWAGALRDAEAVVSLTAAARAGDTADPAFAGASRAAAKARSAGAVALVKLDRFAEAARWADYGVRSAPDDPAAWATVSRVAVAARDLPRAHEAAQRSRELAPDDALGLRALGDVALASNDLQKARAYAYAALARAPDDRASWVLLGRVERRTGTEGAAFAAFSRALEHDPEAVGWYDDEVPLEWAFRVVQKDIRRKRLSQASNLVFGPFAILWAGTVVALLMIAALNYPQVAGAVVVLLGVAWSVRARRRRAAAERYPRDPAERRSEGRTGAARVPGGPGGDSAGAEALRRDIRRALRAGTMWWPLVTGVMLLLGAKWVRDWVIGAEHGGSNGPIGMATLAFAPATLLPPLRARRQLERLPATRRRALEDARVMSRATSAALPLAAAALLYAGVSFIGAANAPDGDPEARGFMLALGVCLVVWALVVALRWWSSARTAEKPSPGSAEDLLVRRAGSLLLPVGAAAAIGVPVVLLTPAILSGGLETNHAYALVYVAVGFGAFARWWQARRAVLRLPYGDFLLRRPVSPFRRR